MTTARQTPVPSEPRISTTTVETVVMSALTSAEERALSAVNQKHAQAVEALRNSLLTVRRSIDRMIDKVEREGHSLHVAWSLADEIATQATEVVRHAAAVVGIASARTAMREAWRARPR